ncbi:MAG TPA: hypothetical protein VES79_10710 [Solirubrobacteraceae bacterium]|nr:hypothetical protein [Solirubrobacteraceae bacterium]
MPGATSRTRSALGRLGAVRRGSALRGGRLGLCAALAGAAVIVGGSAGALLAILILMVILDAAIPLPGATWHVADDRFRRLVRQRRRARGLRRLRGLGPERLDVLDDSVRWASVAPRRALGIESIPIDSITGTVEELKARTFDRSFRPDRSASEHWQRLWIAQAHGATMPPISVYRVGASHVVRDGHHRVSVARDHGYSAVDAEVVELWRSRGGRPSGGCDDFAQGPPTVRREVV